MPLPLFLGIAAAVAAAGGIGSSVHGAVKIKEASNTAKSANERHNSNIARFEICNSRTANTMDALGTLEIDILASFQQFSQLLEQIQNKPDFREFSCQSVELPHYDKEAITRVSIGASVLMGGISGAALGTAGGFAAAGATTAAVMALGTASTGTAIATLSGAAATNATLAALGGGAIAAGGGGIALGSTMLGVTTAGVGILIGGVIFGITGSTLSHKADKAYEEMLETEKWINRICSYLNELNYAALRYAQTLSSIDTTYRRHLNALDAIININAKNDWNEFTQQERLVTANTILLVQLLYKMCQVKLVLTAENDNEINTVNKTAIDDNLHSANIIMVERGFSEANANTIVDNTLTEYETHCLGMYALLYYFAKCDGTVTHEELEIIDASIQPLMSDHDTSATLFSKIETIKSVDNFDFSQLQNYLDSATINSLDEFTALVEQVINASNGITNSEKAAKKKYKDYVDSRKATH